MSAEVDFQGRAHRAPNGVRYIDLWQGLEKLAESQFHSQDADAEAIDGITEELLRDISTADAALWRNLCHGVGCTVYGAVALSWCKNARIEEVWEDWETSGFPITPQPYSERAAKFINPHLLPPLTKLSDISEAAKGRTLSFCAMLAAADAKLIFDIDPVELSKIHPKIAAFLYKTLSQKSNLDEKYKNLLLHWSETVQY